MFNIFQSKKSEFKLLTIVDEPQMTYEYDSIVPISLDGVLDTESKEAIAKYKSNLKLLVKKLKEEKKVTDFRIIREDDVFPDEWKWWVASKNTSIEKKGSNLTYALRVAKAEQKMGLDKLAIPVPPDPDKFKQAINEIDKDFGSVYTPERFRSTKHFTVNTPLGYTGGYNNVDTERNFIVIDVADNFLKSGYGYSIAYHDAYLDVTHDALTISNQAVVLINYNKYKDIINNPNIAKQLSERKVIVFKGDENVAINMILSEMGVLPTKPGNRFIEYDNETLEILDSSIKELASSNGLDYDVSHANFNGNGHFTDTFDTLNMDYTIANENLANFLKSRLPECSVGIDANFRNMDQVIKQVGIDKIISIIDEYNLFMEDDIDKKFNAYKNDRKTITSEISNLFKKTIMLIRMYYKENKINSLGENPEIKEDILRFYQSSTVLEQIEYANKIIDSIELGRTDGGR